MVLRDTHAVGVKVGVVEGERVEDVHPDPLRLRVGLPEREGEWEELLLWVGEVEKLEVGQEVRVVELESEGLGDFEGESVVEGEGENAGVVEGDLVEDTQALELRLSVVDFVKEGEAVVLLEGDAQAVAVTVVQGEALILGEGVVEGDRASVPDPVALVVPHLLTDTLVVYEGLPLVVSVEEGETDKVRVVEREREVVPLPLAKGGVRVALPDPVPLCVEERVSEGLLESEGEVVGERDRVTLLVKEGEVEGLREGLVVGVKVGVRRGQGEGDTLPVTETLEEAHLDTDTEGVEVLEGVSVPLALRVPGKMVTVGGGILEMLPVLDTEVV